MTLDYSRVYVVDALRGVPWPKQYLFRVLKNKLTDEWAEREGEAFRAFGSLSEKYVQARAQTDLGIVGVACGEAVGVLKDRPSAESIVKSMAVKAASLLRNVGKLKFTSHPESCASWRVCGALVAAAWATLCDLE